MGKLFNIGKKPMEKLVEELNEASDNYYNGKETMSNKEFDDKLAELQLLEKEEGKILLSSPTVNVGAEVKDGLPKFKHTYPALSLDKTKDINEFVSKFQRGIIDSGESNNKVVLMWKEDGSTVQAYYENGQLDKLVTRGNGEIGSMITHNAKCIEGLPLSIPYKGNMVVRGEALMSYEEFDRINEMLPAEEQYKNPRNLAAATLSIIDPNEAAKRHLHLKAFQLVYIEEDMKETSTFSGRLNFLRTQHFDVVEHDVICIDELAGRMQAWSDVVDSYSYPVDGLVAAMDNYEYASKLQGTEHHPHIMNGYAFKWSDETVETTLRQIEWSPSRTGLLNPVAVFDPVELEGTTVSRATLHNLSIMRKMRINVGDKIAVYKANKIIPIVDKNLSYDSEPDYTDDFIHDLIGFCPVCGCSAEVKKSSDGIETVYCPNKECPEKMIGKLAHFCERDCMDIQGMSEETITKLVQEGFVSEYLDFFKLSEKPGIALLPGFGQVSWNNMIAAAEKAKTTDFVHFITALSIPGIGKGQAKILLNFIKENYTSICDLVGLDESDNFNPVETLRHMQMFGYDYSAIDGFGPILAKQLSEWMDEHFAPGVDSPETRIVTIVQFSDTLGSKNGTIVPNLKISGKSFCITGKLVTFKNRQELVDKIESLGGKWVDSVSSKTDYLINNDVTSTSGKNKKAHELNIPIISEQDFLNLIQEQE